MSTSRKRGARRCSRWNAHCHACRRNEGWIRWKGDPAPVGRRWRQAFRGEPGFRVRLWDFPANAQCQHRRHLWQRRAERHFDGCARDHDDRRGSIGAAALDSGATWSTVDPVSDCGIRCELASPVRLPGHRGWATYFLHGGSPTVTLAVATQLTLIAEELLTRAFLAFEGRPGGRIHVSFGATPTAWSSRSNIAARRLESQTANLTEARNWSGGSSSDWVAGLRARG